MRQTYYAYRLQSLHKRQQTDPASSLDVVLAPPRLDVLLMLEVVVVGLLVNSSYSLTDDLGFVALVWSSSYLYFFNFK